MKSLRTIAAAAAAATFGLVGCAQTPVDHAVHHPEVTAFAAAGPMSMGGASGSMAQMDEHMKAMREMHEKMNRARTPDEKSALMTEHMKLMQDGMAMMGGMGPGGMMGKGGMDGMKDKAPMSGDMAMHGQMMEKRMEMMQSMMQMMMDRMPQSPAKP
ncbi:MAG: hypothetical protein ABI887_11975 [Burkholderiales bacterium]